MTFKSLFLIFACLVSPLVAEPVLKLHDGRAWSELDGPAWEKLPRIEVTAKARDGTEKKFSGVALAEVLKLLSAPAGESLRGPEMNRVVLFKAGDGYQVAFSLTELDPSFRKQNVVLADKVDGQPLTAFEGPRMLVVADDLRHSRWIRQIREVILTRPEVTKQP